MKNKFVSCSVCFSMVSIKESAIVDKKRVCLKCRGKAKH